MCGIIGGIHTSISRKAMEDMLTTIGHRGPDDRGLYVGDNCWLGNVRLAIQDLTDRGHQPMQSADGRYTLVFNGEIYNHWFVRLKLRQLNIPFQSDSDTETLLKAYIAFGPDCLQSLNGIFSFAIYDTLEDELFIARDPLGVKPLYYYQDGATLLFASELKALIGHEGLNYDLNISSFYHYLLYLYQPGTDTPFQKIHKLLPGHSIHIKKGQPAQAERYYKIPFHGRYDWAKSELQWIQETDRILNKAVSGQMLSDAPLGFFLSGGLDSSLLAAMASTKEQAVPLTCFTINTGNRFGKEGFQDDLPFARMAAKHIGANLVEIPAAATDIAAEFDRMIWQLDEPQADPAALHVLHIAEAAAARGIKVLLSGAGADDVFSGYRRHQAIRWQALVNSVPGWLHRPVTNTIKGLGGHTIARRVSKLFGEGSSALEHRIDLCFWQSPKLIAGLFQEPPEAAGHPYSYFKELLEQIPEEENELNQMLYWELCTFLPDHNLNYTDKLSMAAGVETRVPYLDTELVALSAGMPPEIKMKGGQTKHILRAVAADYLPAEIIHRKKTGFGAPVRQWISEDLQQMVEDRLLSGSLDHWNIFNPAAIRQLVADNAAGRIDGAYTIFALLAIESWLRQFARS